MYALEDEPESGERWRRLGLGALIAGGVVFAMAYGAQRYEPARRLIRQVVQMTVVPDPPKPDALPPPRTEPPPPPPRRAPPPQKKAAAQTAPAPRPDNAPPSSEPVVGLEDGSFGGGAGPSFQVGTTQLGDPTSVARAPALTPPPSRPVPAQLVPAGVPERVERCRYSLHAQRLGLEGLLVIETSIDAEGRVTNARLRKRLEDELDRECLEAVRQARFQPATLAGRAVASTRLLRLRFELER